MESPIIFPGKEIVFFGRYPKVLQFRLFLVHSHQSSALYSLNQLEY